MLTSTKRYILHCISLTLAIACLCVGLFMKYGKQEEQAPLSLDTDSVDLKVTVVKSDSIQIITDVPSLSNDD